MFYEGINALTGIIPVPDKYDIIHNAKNISKVFVIDHYQNPKKSGPSKGRAYHPRRSQLLDHCTGKRHSPGYHIPTSDYLKKSRMA